MVFTHGDEGNFTMQENVMLDRLKSGSTTTAIPFGKLRGGDSRQATTAPKPSTIELRNFRRYFDCPHIIPVRQGELPHELDRYMGTLWDDQRLDGQAFGRQLTKATGSDTVGRNQTQGRRGLPLKCKSDGTRHQLHTHVRQADLHSHFCQTPSLEISRRW